MPFRRFIPVLGLVGGVGSGKSAVANCVKSRRLVAVIDADEAGHQVLTEGSIKHRIRQRFGESVIDERGEVVRAALGRLVFGSTREHRQARTDLEQIVHPRIKEILQERIEQARAAGSVEAIFLDAAVLFEAGWNDLCNSVVYIDTPLATRRNRVAESRGWNANVLKERESNQWPLDRKRKAADDIVGNSGCLDDAAKQLEQLL
ncbi:MAG: dephospho-CoA kinase [Planctomycetes bacterium]|nr:dephospho-CoA kinase [Planctomycetota bacterium]